jgi:hypothetical protein
MKTEWTQQRLLRLFEGYNRRFFKRRLTGWKADLSGDHPGEFGFCNEEAKRISVRSDTHASDQAVRRTLAHEMAHASSNPDHGEAWRLEMQRLRRAGAPTDPLDFLVPYTARFIVTSFMEAASAGEPWKATRELGETFGLCDVFGNPREAQSAVILRECKRFFNLARRGHLKHQKHA